MVITLVGENVSTLKSPSLVCSVDASITIYVLQFPDIFIYVKVILHTAVYL